MGVPCKPIGLNNDRVPRWLDEGVAQYSVERALSFATSSSIALLSALEDAWRVLLLSDL